MNGEYDIESITFGILSPEEIKAMAVCQVDNTKLSGPNSVYDERMGNLAETYENCVSCGLNSRMCPGHFGYIELDEHIIHPLYIKMVSVFLKCFCKHCYRLIIHPDQIKLWGYEKLKGERRFVKIIEKLEKIDICCHCEYPQPNVIFKSKEGIILLEYKQKTGKVSIALSVEDIEKIFNNVLEEDVKTLGFDPDLIQPRNLIMSVFPVLPPVARPYIITEGNICDDDLTTHIVEIVKDNIKLKKNREDGSEPKKRQKFVNSLKFHITTFFNNCVAPDTPILMWDGSTKRADEIVVGDRIIGDDGSIRNVKTICEGEDEMYEISQNKGDTYVVNSNHILSLKFSSHKTIFWLKANKNCPLGSWWVKWYDPKEKRIRTKIASVTTKVTKEQAYIKVKNFTESLEIPDTIDIPVKEYILLSNNVKRCLMGFKSESVIDWPKKAVKLDPYILGMWLGDGNSNGNGFTSADPELVDAWKEWCVNNGAEVVLHPNKGKKDIYFGIKNIKNQGSQRKGPAPLKKILKEYNLVNNKHIPKDYIINDKDTRLQLLAGLIDTDGHVRNSGAEILIAQCAKRLHMLKDIMYIARSLGMTATIHKTNATYTYKGEKKSSLCYRLRMSGIVAKDIPTKLFRKKCESPLWRDVLSSKISVKPVGLGKYNGFSIDGNNRFLLGDFTVTHNSSAKAKRPTDNQPIKGLKERLAGKNGQLRQNHMGKLLLIIGDRL